MKRMKGCLTKGSEEREGCAGLRLIKRSTPLIQYVDGVGDGGS
jgi:hypothetical protein